MTKIDPAIELGIIRVRKFGRVDCSIDVAIKQARLFGRLHLTLGRACAALGFRQVNTWEDLIWRMADYWCELDHTGVVQRTPRPHSGIAEALRGAREMSPAAR